MIKAFAIFCSVIGFFVVALALASMPQSGEVEARENIGVNDGCATHEVALDEGYGVSRKVVQRVCGLAGAN